MRSSEDPNRKVGNQTKQQVREQQERQRGGDARQEQAESPEPFRHQSDRARRQPEINHSQEGTDKAPESGTER